MDNKSYFFVFWHMQLYMSWYIRSFFGFTFLNILYFFKYSCTNIFHRRSLSTFYYMICKLIVLWEIWNCDLYFWLNPINIHSDFIWVCSWGLMLVQVMAWCHQVTRHYLIQCWPRYLTKYGNSELFDRWFVNGNDSRYRCIAYWHEIMTSTHAVLRLEYSGECRSIPRLQLPLHFQVISSHHFGYWNANYVYRIQ